MPKTNNPPKQNIFTPQPKTIHLIHYSNITTLTYFYQNQQIFIHTPLTTTQSLLTPYLIQQQLSLKLKYNISNSETFNTSTHQHHILTPNQNLPQLITYTLQTLLSPYHN